MSGNLIDETGNKYGARTVIKLHGKDKQGAAMWECLCQCGAISVVSGSGLRCKNTTSCGCLQDKRKPTRELHIRQIRQKYLSARSRCTKTYHSEWKNYGGRGIKFKLESIDEFVARMEPTWFAGATLGRINNDGHYEYGNIRWETTMQQSCNKRSSVFFTYNDRTMTQSQWARELGITSGRLHYRVKTWGLERAMTTHKK